MERARPAKLTAELMESFAGMFLSPRYDGLVTTPEFHRKGWELYCDTNVELAEIVAPREHAKSTAFTFDYILGESLFRQATYTILIGATEEMASEQLSNIIEEVRENEDLQREFDIAELERDSQTDLIVRHGDGHRWRVLARGAEQKIRGKLWNGTRPNLLVGDDMEDDEQVLNVDRRRKFRNWFFRAARQAVSRRGRIRVHGTILHEDALLARLLKNKMWKSLFYKAHNSFDDFGGMLWPAAWPEDRLRRRQAELIEDGDAAGYAQEFLNDPQDSSEAYLRKGDLLDMTEQDHRDPKKIIAAADFAVSKADMANRTSFSVGGLTYRNRLCVLDCRVGRWDSLEWIEEMFAIQQRYEPEEFFVEDGVIWKAVKRMVYNEMEERNVTINITAVPSTKDKATRGRTLQKRSRAGTLRFDKTGEWYAGHEIEILKFTGSGQALLDDQFDSDSLLAIGAERLGRPQEEDFMEESEMQALEMARIRRRGAANDNSQQGRNATTSY